MLDHTDYIEMASQITDGELGPVAALTPLSPAVVDVEAVGGKPKYRSDVFVTREHIKRMYLDGAIQLETLVSLITPGLIWLKSPPECKRKGQEE